jgi:16S rRNA (guanine(966)-N(2))-methyltransferase RsmD
VRPTTDMSKEALFNVLNNHFSFVGLKVLDLFAGTGNISFEFASRGSDNITSIDQDFGCIKFIKQVADEYDFNIAALKSDVFKFLEKNNNNYDIIFADPPYANPKINEIPDLIFNNNILSEGGMLVVEHPAEISFTMHPNFNKHKVYGHVNFTFFEHK